MFGLIPWRKRNGRQQNGGTLTPAAGPQFLSRMRDDFDRLFSDFFAGWPALWQGWEGWGLELEEKEDAYVVRVEAPGFEPEDFDLQIRGDRLLLKASRKTESGKEKEKFREWSAQEFYREVVLPGGVEVDKVEAKYRNGVLTVTLPRTEESKGQRIAIKGE